MDHTAIKQIQTDAAAVCAALEIVNLKTAEPVVALPDNFKVTSLDKYMANKSRFTGVFATSRPASFVKYHESQNREVDVFVDPKKMTALSIYDLGTLAEPGHCGHNAKLTMERTAEFSAYITTVGMTVSQRDLAEWLGDWRDYITAIDEDDVTIPIKALISTVRNITVEALAKRDTVEGSYSSNKSTLESVEAKSSAGKLPKVIKFTCVPYNGLPEQTFVFRISIKPAADKTTFGSYRVRGDAEDEKTAENFCMLIEKELGGVSNIYHGTFTP